VNASVLDPPDPTDAVWVFPSQLLTVEVLRRPIESTQYTSLAFGRRCQQAGITPSMGSVGDAYDNAITESFFATLECELLDRHRFRTHTEARMAVFDYLEGFYNPRRRHSALGYLSPAGYERSHQARYAAA
jgi:putative transposase